MKLSRLLAGAVAVTLFAALGSSAAGDSNRDGNRNLKAELKGFEEIPTLIHTGERRIPRKNLPG